MGLSRVVSSNFWTDEKVESFTPEERYFMLFLLTNPHVRLLGIYHITIKQMSFFTGYDYETINKLIKRFEKDYDLIRYVDNEIAIKNFLKHSIVKGGKPVQDSIEADIKNTKNKKLINWMFSEIEKDNLNETVLYIINNYINNNTNNINEYVYEYEYGYGVSSTYRGRIVDVSSSQNKNNKQIKHKHGEYKHVLLTDEQYQKLQEDLGESKLAEYIKKVDEYCQQYGKTYEDYNLTIRKWFDEDNQSNDDYSGIVANYDTSKNPEFDLKRFNEIKSKREKLDIETMSKEEYYKGFE